MNSLQFAFLVLCIVGLVVSSCPDDCSGHGYCLNSGVCDCGEPYYGKDCSIFNKTLTSGHKSSSQVNARDWVYFNIQVSPKSTMDWWMNQTSFTGDCDLYVQKSQLPSLSSFVARNISMIPDLSLVVPSDNGGIYYAGVYGYRSCSFDIQVNLVSECPSDCHSHGDCVDGGCACHDGYYGDACENSVIAMTPEEEYPSSVEFQQWVYYSYVAPQVLDEVDWILTKTGSSSEDCDIYVSHLDFPTLWNWDFANVTLGDTKTIRQTQVIVGEAYIMGVYGYSNAKCQFTAKIRAFGPSSPSECPNGCSGHQKSCWNNVCTCTTGYSGAECETMTDIVDLGKTYSGFVGENAWNYYSLNGDEASALAVSLTRTSSSGDPDLYIKAGEKPSRFDFDYVDITQGTEMSVIIENPEGNIWWVGIFGFYGSDYTLKVEGTDRCSCVTSQVGSCNHGSSICICKEGFAGDDCSFPVTALTSGVPVKDQIVYGQGWKYYSIQSSATSAMSLSVVEKQSSGLVWVFVSHDEPPTLVDYDFSDKSSHKAIHQISYSTPQEESGTLYIGVYGSPNIPDFSVDGSGTQAIFDLSCWLADF